MVKNLCDCLPDLVFPAEDIKALSYRETLCKIHAKLTEVINQVNQNETNISNFTEDMTNKYNELVAVWKETQAWITNYFKNLDVQEEINNKLDDMVSDGTMSDLLAPFVVNGGMPKFVENISDMSNNNQIYVLISNSHIYQWNGTEFIDTGVIYTAASNEYIGQSIPTTAARLSDFITQGSYNVPVERNKNLTDLPTTFNINHTSTLYNIRPAFFGAMAIQFLIAQDSTIWIRLVTVISNGNTIFKDWEKLTNTYKYSALSRSITALKDVTKAGSYNIRADDMPNLTDLPANINVKYACVLYNIYPAFSGTFTVQVLIDQESNMWIRSITGGTVFRDWISLTNNYIYKTLPTTATKLTNFYNAGSYNIPVERNKNLTDLPTTLNKKYTTTLFNINPAFFGAMTIQKLIDQDMNEFTRLINNADGSIFKDWKNLNTYNKYMSYTASRDVTSIFELQEYGSYSINADRFNLYDDFPINAVPDSFTLFNIGMAYSGVFIIQILFDAHNHIWQRVINTDNNAVFLDWRNVNNNGIRAACFGDSRTIKNPETLSAYPDVIKKIKKYFVVDNFGVNGAYYQGTDVSSSTTIIKKVNFINYDIVTLNYGYNDFWGNKPLGTLNDTTTATTTGGIYQSVKAIMGSNPNCYIFAFSPIPAKNINIQKFIEYNNMIIEKFKLLKIPVFNTYDDLLNEFQYDNFFNIDDVHGNDYTLMGEYMSSKLP